MSLLPVGLGSGAGYEIPKSLRFRASASAYLSRIMGAPTDGKKVTYRIFAKRGAISSAATQNLLGAVTGSSTTTYAQFYFLSSNIIGFQEWVSGAVQCSVSTTAVYRDPSAFYDVLLVIDSTQATAADRLKVYVNGVQQTLTVSTAMPLNYTTAITKSGYTTTIGSLILGSTAQQFFDGYGSEIILVDGQALTPSSFGQTDANGVWQPKKYTGTYGTNGFYLPFNDGTNLTNLCLDRSGNGNNWTATNVSLTAGATYDWMDDTPSNNFAVLNPLSVKHSTTLAEGNLKETASGLRTGSRGTSAVMTSGKFYAEYTITGSGGGSAPGFLTATIGVVDPLSSTYYPETTGVGYFSLNGNKYVSGTTSAYGSSWSTNGGTFVLGVALNIDGGTVEFYLDGVAQGSISLPSTTGGWIFTWGWASSIGSGSAWANFGQRPFAYTPPTGFKALCTKNLPVPVIADPKKHFDVSIYSGNSGTNNISSGVVPDLVWVKTRNVAVDHGLVDTVRGADKFLFPNLTNAEVTATTSITPNPSGGFTVVGASSVANFTGNTYAGWQWKANGSAVTNTAGTITSQVSANTTAGFSIVTYTGTGANATVGHGLGVAPRMVITRNRTSSPVNWQVYHASTGATGVLFLDQTSAFTVSSVSWNNTAPSSTVFSVGSAANTNQSGQSFVAYCFAEVPGFSRIGSYTGNGSADGPFVYCGFRPRWVMVKRTDATGNWKIMDTARNPANVASLGLYPNLTNAEDVGNTSDLLSQGFKLRETFADYNASGGTYIFLAFAESPFNTSRAR